MGAPAQPPAPQGADSAAAERKLVHLGVAAAVTGMLCWITGIVLIPPAATADGRAGRGCGCRWPRA